jgi:hypothetical protein
MGGTWPPGQDGTEPMTYNTWFYGQWKGQTPAPVRSGRDGEKARTPKRRLPVRFRWCNGRPRPPASVKAKPTWPGKNLPKTFDFPTVAAWISDMIGVCDTKAPMAVRWVHAVRAARYLPSQFAKPEAKRALRDLCRADLRGKVAVSPYQLMRDDVVLKELIRAADEASTPQDKIRLGKDWITGGRGRIRRIRHNIRPIDLETTDLIHWVVSRTYRNIQGWLVDKPMKEYSFPVTLPSGQGNVGPNPIFENDWKWNAAALRHVPDRQLLANQRRIHDERLRRAPKTARQCEIVDLYLNSRLPLKDIAHNLGIAPSTVRTILARLRHKKNPST